MIERPTMSALPLLTILLAGCGTVDLTKEHTGRLPTCEIHKSSMQREPIRVAGEILYLPEYRNICRKQFPHHGGHRYNFETEDTPYDRDVIDFVCPECDKAYLLYWKATRKK
jgi:hypothetical protein